MPFDFSQIGSIGQVNAGYTPPAESTAPAPSTENMFQSAWGFGTTFAKGMVTSMVQGVKDIGTLANTASAGLINRVQLNDQIEKQEYSRVHLNEAMNNIARLPKDQQRDAFNKLHTFDRTIKDSTLEETQKLLTDFGVKEGGSTLDIVKQGVSKTISAEFAAAALYAPVSGAASAGKNVIFKIADNIAGRGVNVVVRTAVESAAKTAAEKIAGSTVENMTKTFAEGTAESLARQAGDEGVKVIVRNGAKVASETFSGDATKVLYGMARSATLNGSAAVAQDWANGNNFSTPEERAQALEDFGMNALFGGVLEGLIGAVGLGKGLYDAPKNLTYIARGMDNIAGSTIRRATVDSYVSAKSFEGKAKVSEGMAEIGAKGRATQAATRQSKLDSDLTGFVNKMPNPFHSLDEQAVHLRDTHGVEMTVAEPGTTSGVKKTKTGYSVSFKKGDLNDYNGQKAKVTRNVLKDNGLTSENFRDELDKMPSSGLGDETTKAKTDQSKMDTVFSQLAAGNKEVRAANPKMAAAYDSVHGVFTKADITDSIKVWAKSEHSGIGDDLYHEVDQFAKENSRTNVPDPQRPGLTERTDENRYSQIWKEVYNIMEGTGTKDEKVKSLNKILTDNKYINDVRDLANINDTSANKQLFDKVDKAINSIAKPQPVYDKDGLPVIDSKTGDQKMISVIDQKIQMWNEHMATFHKDVELPGRKSPLDVGAPKLAESVPEAPTTPSQPSMGETPKSQPIETTKTTPTEATPEVTTKAEELKKGVDPDTIVDKNTPDYTGGKEVRKEELDIAAKLVASDYEKAVRVATGLEEPKGLGFTQEISARVYTGEMVTKEAIARGDWETVSKVSSALSDFGGLGTQTAQALGARNVFGTRSITGMLDEARNSVKGRTLTSEIIQKDIKDTLESMGRDITKGLDGASSLIDKLTC